MSDMDFSISLQENNIEEILKEKDEAVRTALEACGLIMEGYAKKLCPVDTGLLRNSITHEVDGDGNIVHLGTNVEYAPYVELGTGKYATNGGGRQTPWAYKDEKGNWHWTSGAKPRPYIRPAVENHLKQYEEIIKNALNNS